MKIKCAYTELVEVDKLIPNPKNYNHHSDKQIEMLSKIINYQGQRSPIVVSKRRGFVCSGHGRLIAIKKLGWEKCAVDYQHFDNEAEEYSHMIADNKIAELADADTTMLDELVVSLGNDFDSELLGMQEKLVTIVEDKIESVSEPVEIKMLECPHCLKPFEKDNARSIRY